MAIAPGSYSFMGGAVLGKGSEGQFVLVRSGSLLTAFTDDEYNACLEAVHDGKAVCVQYKIGTVVFQTQLLNVTGLGDLQLVDTSVQNVTHYRVASTSPHTVSIVKTGSAQQFVLERDDMSTAFTASEYLQCQTRVSEGTALCVQWKSGSARMQAQLATMLADGSLLFSHTTVDLETIYIVAGSEPHNITARTYSLGGGSQVQSDWTETDSTDPSYIQNKPTLATVATTGRYKDLTGKPTIPAEQVNSDWSAQFGKAKILNKPIHIVNTTGGFQKTLTADDVSNGYVILTESVGMYTGSNAYINPTFMLFASLNHFRLNLGFATSAYDHMEVGLYSEGIVGNYVKYFDLPHQAIVDDAGKDWGISGWWSLKKDKALYMYTKLYFTQNSVKAGDEIWFKGMVMIVGDGIFN